MSLRLISGITLPGSLPWPLQAGLGPSKSPVFPSLRYWSHSSQNSLSDWTVCFFRTENVPRSSQNSSGLKQHRHCQGSTLQILGGVQTHFLPKSAFDVSLSKELGFTDRWKGSTDRRNNMSKSTEVWNYRIKKWGVSREQSKMAKSTI